MTENSPSEGDSSKYLGALKGLSSDILEQLTDKSVDFYARENFNYSLYLLRNFEQSQRKPETPRFRYVRRLLHGIAAAAATSSNTDNRANGLMLLYERVADGDRAAARLLRTFLAGETDSSVVRVLGSGSRSGGWFPDRFPGIESNLLEEFEALGKCHVDRDLAPLLPGDLKLFLSGGRNYLNSLELPARVRAAISVHWVRMLIKDVESLRSSGRKLDSLEARIESNAIDAELSFRELHANLRQMFAEESVDNASVESALNAAEKLVQVSEESAGLPLTSFSEYFVDHFLPLIGLFILTQDVERSANVGRAAIAVISKHVAAWEIEAYESFINDCVAWRRNHGSGLTADSPLVLGTSREEFSIQSPAFRRIWMSGGRSKAS
jgi:hypothetical protein